MHSSAARLPTGHLLPSEVQWDTCVIQFQRRYFRNCRRPNRNVGGGTPSQRGIRPCAFSQAWGTPFISRRMDGCGLTPSGRTRRTPGFERPMRTRPSPALLLVRRGLASRNFWLCFHLLHQLLRLALAARARAGFASVLSLKTKSCVPNAQAVVGQKARTRQNSVDECRIATRRVGW
jgi:hypothetical protein